MSRYRSDWIERNTFYAPIPGSNPSHYQQYERPVIVCLCGSTKFMEAWQAANLSETLEGRIVLSIGCNTKSDADLQRMGELTAEKKAELDKLHKHKIDLADEILVLNVGGYVGESTRSEVEHAYKRGKTIRLERGASGVLVSPGTGKHAADFLDAPSHRRGLARASDRGHHQGRASPRHEGID